MNTATSQNPKKLNDAFPFISIIVPVYNDEKRIRKCIEALLAQTYPGEQYEVIIVDNGSTDKTRNIAQEYPITLLVEDIIQGSYAARNKGIKHASGEIIAFTDSDCIPVSGWVEEAIKALQLQKAELVSGNVRFIYSSHKTGAEIFDSITNMQIEQNIRERNVSKTANLIVFSKIFEKVGLFPINLKSGGDVIWTGKATTQGFNLVYAPHAEVAHPTRRLYALMKKQYRVGKGQRKIWAESEISLEKYLLSILKFFFPISISYIRKLIAKQKITISPTKIIRVWFAAYLCRIATGFGNFTSIESRKSEGNNKDATE